MLWILCAGILCLTCSAVPAPNLIVKEKPKAKYENPCARVMNNTLRGILNNPNHRCFGNQTYREWMQFFDWAVWGWLSGDSEFRKDERLPGLVAEWMDHHLKVWRTPPSDPAKRAKWKPDTLDLWTYHVLAFPLAELKNAPDLAEKIGAERLRQYEKVIMDNLQGSKEAFRKRLKQEKGYLNLVHHTVPQMVAGYLLTGDRSWLEECEPAMQEQLRQMMPNGSFPYRLGIFGPNHYENDFGYYHAIDVRAAYLLLVTGNSKTAKEVLVRSVPYYPLNIEPGGHTNDGAAIWWKDQWRNWWPHHIAMVAAAAGDGENAAMAVRYGAMDYFDNVIGAHAFRMLAEKKIAEKKQRTGYLMNDPDIRGWRSRFPQPDGSTFSVTVTTSPNSYTKAGAMLVKDRSMTALHHARMSFRRRPIPGKAKMFDPDVFNVTSRNGVRGSAEFKIGNIAAIGIDDAIALCGETWKKSGQSLWDGRHRELWLVTPQGMAGLLVSTLEKERSGAEFAHEYKMIAKNVKWDNAAATLDNAAHLRIWKTNFPYQIHEKVRRYVYDSSPRRPDFQLVLSDRERSPEEKIQSGAPDAKTPAMKQYSAGSEYFSMASFTPAASQFKQISVISQKPVMAFLAVLPDGTRWLTAYNPAEKAAELNVEDNTFRIEAGKTFLKRMQ